MRRFLLGLALATSGASWSQQLDLEACLRRADTANLTLRNAKLDLFINDKQIDAYKSARLPHLNFNGDYKYNAVIPGQLIPAQIFGGPPGTFQAVQFGVPYNLSNTFQLNQVVYNPQVNYALKVLELNTAIVAIQQRQAQQEIRQQVASTYFNLQAINRQLSYVQSNIERMDRLVSNMQALLRNELVIGTEVDKLNINKLSLINTQQTLNATKEQLKSYLRILLGMNKDANIELAPDSLLQQSILVDVNSVQRPETELLAAQISLNEEERKGTKMAYLPSVSAYGIYQYNYNINPEDNFRKGINGAFIGLRLDWTLFDGFEKKNKLAVNKLNAEKLRNQEVLLTQQLEMKTENAKRQIGIQANALKIAEEQLVLAQRVYKQAEAQFQQGTVSSNDLITAENGQQQAQTNVVAAYIQLRQAELELLKSIGNIK